MDIRVKVVIGVIISIFLFLIVYMSIGLENGELLTAEEYKLLEVSSITESVNATCLNHYGDVISTEDKYNQLVADCKLTDVPSYTESDFYDGVFVVMFYDGSSSNKPKAFYDYYFMADDHEVITVRYHHSLFGPTKDGQWYMYFIHMTKDQIHSGDILFR